MCELSQPFEVTVLAYPRARYNLGILISLLPAPLAASFSEGFKNNIQFRVDHGPHPLDRDSGLAIDAGVVQDVTHIDDLAEVAFLVFMSLLRQHSVHVTDQTVMTFSSMPVAISPSLLSALSSESA